MARRKLTTRRPSTLDNLPRESDPEIITGDEGESRAAFRLLVMHPDRTVRTSLTRTLRAAGFVCAPAMNHARARVALSNSRYDLALIATSGAQSGEDPIALAHELAADPSAPGVVVLADNPTLDTAVLAMRSGALDLIAAPFDDEDLAQRVRAACDAVRRDRARDLQILRLKGICRELSAARHAVTRQVDTLCGDLASAYQELAAQVTHMKAATEFATLIRQDLDVEAALRTCLEFLLVRTGPTNAAIFLPSDCGDFALGAYVNYDTPRDSTDMLLDHIANAIAPVFADDDRLSSFDGADDLARRVGDDADWLEDQRVIVLPCKHENDCLAMLVLFRDRLTPFPTDALPLLELIGAAFAEQLERVLRVHHRVENSGLWSDTDEDDIGGMAA